VLALVLIFGLEYPRTHATQLWVVFFSLIMRMVSLHCYLVLLCNLLNGMLFHLKFVAVFVQRKCGFLFHVVCRLFYGSSTSTGDNEVTSKGKRACSSEGWLERRWMEMKVPAR